MIEYTIKKFKNIPDSDILINPKEFPLITKDHKYAYDHLFVNKQIKEIDNIYFIGSQQIKDNTLDISIPLIHDWKNTELSKVEWKNKKPLGFYRGESIGCGQKIENNQRIKLADISYQWSKTKDKNNLLDCALSSIDNTIKIYKQFIGLQNINRYDYLVGTNKNLNEYKYIFNIQENLQNTNSLILKVDSEYKLWFDPLLKNNKHVINIKSDYSDLIDKLKYVKENDDKSKKIADNGYKFIKRYINKKMIATYWFYYMLNINHFN